MIKLPPFAKHSLISYDLMQRQERYGVYFDIEGAEKLYEWVGQRMADIEAEVEPQLPPRKLNKTEENLWTPPKRQFKKDGTPSAICLRWFDTVTKTASGYVGTKLGKEYKLPYNNIVISSLPMELKPILTKSIYKTNASNSP